MSERRTSKASKTKRRSHASKPARGKKGPPKGRGRLELIGIDLADRRPKLGLRILLPLLATGLIVALGLSALRVDHIRMRYALADALAEEQRLVEQQRTLTVSMRQLRDPIGLAARARELGFGRPERIIDLPQTPPAPPAPHNAPIFRSEGTALAAVGATQP